MNFLAIIEAAHLLETDTKRSDLELFKHFTEQLGIDAAGAEFLLATRPKGEDDAARLPGLRHPLFHWRRVTVSAGVGKAT